jgi:hypothetical protein
MGISIALPSGQVKQIYQQPSIKNWDWILLEYLGNDYPAAQLRILADQLTQLLVLRHQGLTMSTPCTKGNPMRTPPVPTMIIAIHTGKRMR